MKKIAVIGDIHCHLQLFEQVINEVDGQVDDYIFLGDYITDGPHANEILNIVKNRSENVILGNREVDIINYDEQKIINSVRYRSKMYTLKEINNENLGFLKKLPIYQIIEIKNKRICFCHGSPYHVKDEVFNKSLTLFDRLIADFDCDVYLFGHQHRPFYLEYRKRIFINPGSVNSPLDGRATCKYGILEIAENIVYHQKEIVYDWHIAKKYYLESDYFKACPEWSNLLIYILRDGIDYRKLFIDKVLQARIDWEHLHEDEWHNLFVEFMKKYNLKIIKAVANE